MYIVSGPRLTDMMTFRSSSQRLLEAFEARESPSADDVSVCLSAIGQIVHARYGDISARDAEEISSDAITALYEAAFGRTQAIEEPAAWLVAVARNKAYDSWKAQQRTTPTETPADHEQLVDSDVATSLVDALADRQQVRSAIRSAIAAGDRTVVRIVVAWLDLYELTGKAPSVRQVAHRSEVPRSTVSKAMHRFEGYLRAVDE